MSSVWHFFCAISGWVAALYFACPDDGGPKPVAQTHINLDSGKPYSSKPHIMTGSNTPPQASGPSEQRRKGSPHPTGNPSVLNRERLKLVFGDDTEYMHEFLRSFLDICPGYMDDIRAAVEVGDAEKLATKTHRLHSSLESFQADAACEVAAYLEKIARAGELESVPEVMKDLEAEIDRLKRVLSREIS